MSVFGGGMQPRRHSAQMAGWQPRRFVAKPARHDKKVEGKKTFYSRLRWAAIGCYRLLGGRGCGRPGQANPYDWKSISGPDYSGLVRITSDYSGFWRGGVGVI